MGQNKEVVSVWKKMGPKSGIIKDLPQKGKQSDVLRDAARSARAPGKRISKTGNVYWETRKNRSDVVGRNL